MTGTDVDNAAQAILQDIGRAHWPLASVLQWIHEAEVQHLIYAPRSVAKTVSLSMVTGQAQQTLSALYASLLEVTQNMGADGATPGRPVTFTSLDWLRAIRPTWRTETGAEVKHIMRDERDERAFYVWPAPLGTLKLEGIVTVAPVPLAGLTDTLTVSDSYIGSMTDYVLHRAYTQDSEDSVNANLSALYYAAFAQKLDIKIKNAKASGMARNSGDNPTYPATEKTGT